MEILLLGVLAAGRACAPVNLDWELGEPGRPTTSRSRCWAMSAPEVRRRRRS